MSMPFKLIRTFATAVAIGSFAILAWSYRAETFRLRSELAARAPIDVEMTRVLFGQLTTEFSPPKFYFNEESGTKIGIEVDVCASPTITRAEFVTNGCDPRYYPTPTVEESSPQKPTPNPTATFDEPSCAVAERQAEQWYNGINNWAKGKSVNFNSDRNEWVVTVDDRHVAFSCAFTEVMPP